MLWMEERYRGWGDVMDGREIWRARRCYGWKRDIEGGGCNH